RARARVRLPNGVDKPCFPQSSSRIALARVQIQIARQNDLATASVCIRCVQNFLQLPQPESFVFFAFQVQIVSRYGLPVDFHVRNKSDPSPQPFLERLDPRQIPVRLPKIRLMLKPYQSWVFDWPRRERSLALKSRGRLRTLRQLLEFR